MYNANNIWYVFVDIVMYMCSRRPFRPIRSDPVATLKIVKPDIQTYVLMPLSCLVEKRKKTNPTLA